MKITMEIWQYKTSIPPLLWSTLYRIVWYGLSWYVGPSVPMLFSDVLQGWASTNKESSRESLLNIQSNPPIHSESLFELVHIMSEIARISIQDFGNWQWNCVSTYWCNVEWKPPMARDSCPMFDCIGHSVKVSSFAKCVENCMSLLRIGMVHALWSQLW